jgi:hypothetical protein
MYIRIHGEWSLLDFREVVQKLGIIRVALRLNAKELVSKHSNQNPFLLFTKRRPYYRSPILQD